MVISHFDFDASPAELCAAADDIGDELSVESLHPSGHRGYQVNDFGYHVLMTYGIALPLLYGRFNDDLLTIGKMSLVHELKSTTPLIMCGKVADATVPFYHCVAYDPITAKVFDPSFETYDFDKFLPEEIYGAFLVAKIRPIARRPSKTIRTVSA